MGAPHDLIAGRYRLERRIAAGGMGVVWEARDELLQRVVAVKQLRTFAGVPDDEIEVAKQRAMREARITARLHHPHAVPVFDTVEHEGEPCLVMQFVPSEPLSAIVRRRGALPADEVARIGAEVAGALAAAHDLGIVHRDVKPGNILIADADGAAMLSDFGISHATGDASLTSTGFVHGTPAYLAPEVARGEDSTFASDVFSLGSTLYAAFEGHPPFGEAPNSIAVLHRVASGGFDAPTRSGPLGALLLQLMASAPEDRPSMAEVARRLAALEIVAQEAPSPTRTLPIAAEAADDSTARSPINPTLILATEAPAAAPPPPPESEEPPDEPTPPPAAPASSDSEPPRRRRRFGWLLGVLAVIVLGALIWLGVSLALPKSDPVASGTPRSTSSAGRGSSTPSARPSSTAPSPSPSRTQTSAVPTPTRTSGGSDGARTPVQAIQRYYQLVPKKLDEAWPLLTADYQTNHAGGRAAYDRFWAPIKSVQAKDVRAIGTDQVEATITYRYDDGHQAVEDTTFGLVSDGGVLKIASSTVNSSSG